MLEPPAQRMPPLGLFFSRQASKPRASIPGGDGHRLTRQAAPSIYPLVSTQPKRGTVAFDSNDSRIAREEEYWNAPRLFRLGFVFLGICLVVIYAMAKFAFAMASG